MKTHDLETVEQVRRVACQFEYRSYSGDKGALLKRLLANYTCNGKALAAFFNVPVPTMYVWMRTIKKDQKLKSKGRNGSLTAEQESALVKIVSEANLNNKSFAPSEIRDEVCFK